MYRAARALNWDDLTLPGQFLLAGAVVMTVAMVFVGNWVSHRIENAVVMNSATSAALFMESFISPISQELAESDELSPPAKQALAELFDGTALGERVVSYKIWKEGGRIVHASDTDLIGQVFQPSDDLQMALAGQIASSFEDLNDEEDQAEAQLDFPVLEVYSPIRQAYTGEIIAVAEFYEIAAVLDREIRNARQTSWLVVGGAFAVSGVFLFGIVQAGGRTIRLQKNALSAQLAKTEKISAQNAALRKSAVAASARATAQTEQAIRRIGSDLHDGPGQYLSLASLRLDGALAEVAKNKDATLVRESLDKAMDELRILSRGLALPDLESLDLRLLIERAVNDHRRQTGLEVQISPFDMPDAPLNYAQKLCIYRFLQESLSNATRHAHVDEARLAVIAGPSDLTLTVADDGPGFDPAQTRMLRHDGGQGLLGLADRAESIGGQVTIKSAPQKGTRLTLTLPFEENGA